MKSMNIIYLDTLFLVNFIFDYILLLCTARVSGTEIRRLYILAAATLGGLYACLCALRNGWIQHPIIQSCCSIMLCILSFGNKKSLLRCTVVFLAISAMLGGILSAVSVNIHNVLFFPVDFKATVLIFAVVYIVLYIFFRKFPQLQQKEYHNIVITINNQTIKCKAIRDTGNELYDPITNLPVLVCDASTLQPLFPDVLLSMDDPFRLFMEINQSKGWENKMKLIPYRTISESGILLGFKPDSIRIDHTEEHYIVAIAPTQLRASDTCQAIL